MIYIIIVNKFMMKNLADRDICKILVLTLANIFNFVPLTMNKFRIVRTFTNIQSTCKNT